jgi:hypothetical protein
MAIPPNIRYVIADIPSMCQNLRIILRITQVFLHYFYTLQMYNLQYFAQISLTFSATHGIFVAVITADKRSLLLIGVGIPKSYIV